VMRRTSFDIAYSCAEATSQVHGGHEGRLGEKIKNHISYILNHKSKKGDL